MAFILFLLMGAAAPNPVQRNNFTTNVPGEPVIGGITYSNGDPANFQTNHVVFTGGGIQSFAPGSRAIYKLYGWVNGNDKAFDWFNSASYLKTNGGANFAGPINAILQTNTSPSISTAPLALFGSSNTFYFPSNAVDGFATVSDANGSYSSRPVALTNFSPGPSLVFIGDSLTSDGYFWGDFPPQSGAGNDWPQQLTNLLSYRQTLFYTNRALYGQSLSNNLARYQNDGAAFRVGSNNNANGFLFLWNGVIDIQGGFSTNATYDNLSNYWFKARSDGYTVVAFTITSWAGQGFTFENNRTNLNLLIKQDRTLYDYLVDTAAIFPDTSETIDGIHLTAAANLKLARWINTNIMPRQAQMPMVGGRHVGQAVFDSLKQIPPLKFTIDSYNPTNPVPPSLFVHTNAFPGWPLITDGSNSFWGGYQVGNAQIVIEGDSMSSENTGEWAGLGNSWGRQLTNRFWRDFSSHTNFSSDGDSVFNMATQYPTQGKTVKPNGTNNANAFYFHWIGVNDIRTGAVATVVYQNLSNQWLQARNDGYSVVAFTHPFFTAANGSNAAVEVQRAALNTAIKGDRTLFDYLIDVDAMTTTTNNLFDGLHFNAAGNLAIAQTIWTNVLPRKQFFSQSYGKHLGTANFDAHGATARIPLLSVTPSNLISPSMLFTLPSAFSTNVIEVRNTSSNISFSIASNGVVQLQITNSSIIYPANYTIFNQTADGVSCTNITTAFTTVLGTGVGSLTLPANFWQVGRSIRAEVYGQYWTGAAPLNTYVVAKLGSLIVCSNLFVPTAVMTQRPWYGDIMITCRTNSATVGAFMATGKLNFPSGAAFIVQAFTNLMTITDSTASMAFDLQATNGASTTSIQTENATLSLR